MKYHGLEFDITPEGKIVNAVVGEEGVEAQMVSQLFDYRDHVLHVGTGLGLTAIHIAAAGATLTAFEMIKELVELVQQGVSVDGMRLHLTCAAIVAGDLSGRFVNFHQSGRYLESQICEAGDKSTIAFSILEVLEDNRTINCLSLDVEGYETNLLEDLSAAQYSRLDKIHVEYHPRVVGMVAYWKAHLGVLAEGFIQKEVQVEFIGDSDKIDVINVAYVKHPGGKEIFSAAFLMGISSDA